MRANKLCKWKFTERKYIAAFAFPSDFPLYIGFLCTLLFIRNSAILLSTLFLSFSPLVCSIWFMPLVRSLYAVFCFPIDVDASAVLCNLFWTFAFPFGEHIRYMDGDVYVWQHCHVEREIWWENMLPLTLKSSELYWKVNDLPGKVQCQWIQRPYTKIK